MKENNKSSQKPPLGKSAQKKLWQARTYEALCKNLLKRTISETARINQIKTSTFSRLKKKGDSGIDLSQKGQGKPKEFDDKEIKQIEPTFIAGSLNNLQAHIRLQLAQKRNISLDQLDRKLVSKKYLCDLKKLWFELNKTDKKQLKASLKNSTHPLNIIQKQQSPCYSNFPSDLSSDLINEKQHQNYSYVDSLEPQQSSAFDPSDYTVVAPSIQDMNSHMESQEIPNFCSQGFYQELIENPINNNISAAIQGCQESQQCNYGDQQWPSLNKEASESPFENVGHSTIYQSLDLSNLQSSNFIEFECEYFQSHSISFDCQTHHSVSFQPMSSLHNLESYPNQESSAISDNSTQATDSFQRSGQLEFSNLGDCNSFDEVDQYLSNN